LEVLAVKMAHDKKPKLQMKEPEQDQEIVGIIRELILEAVATRVRCHRNQV
jgi:hypothetical protein